MTTTSHPQTMHPIDLYLQHLADIGRPRTTIDTYATPLRRAQAELPHGLCALPEELERWLGSLRSSSSRNTYRAALRGFYSWALKRHLIDQNPAIDLEPVKRRRTTPRPATLEQLGTILERAEDPVRLWALVAAYAGARCIEISRLERKDITEDTTYLWGKGDKERAVPTHPQVWAAVRDLPPGLLAGGRTANRVSNAAAKVFDRIGVPDVTLHRLRKLAGTLWQQATGDIRVTQELLGHASVATTMVYTAVSDAAMRRAVLAIPSLTSGAAAPTAAGPGRP